MKKSVNCAFSYVAQIGLKLLLPVLTIILLSGGKHFVNGEGSPQFKPDTTKTTYLMILNTQPTYGTFAGYSAADTNRLFIRINSPSTERIYFGIGQRTSTTGWYFRVKDPNGNIIYGPALLPTSGTGFISYHSQAIAGPNTFNSQGYAPFVITPTAGVSGNYYIEFNQGSGTAVSNNKEIGLGIFDVTVGIPSTSTVVQGRLYSYNWSFNTDSYANQFYGSFYIYGADSSVTKVDLNGIKPFKFRVSCNSYGALSTNNPNNNRRSQLGFHVPPELRLFLRDPDHTAFPSGGLQFLVPPVTLTGCSRDSLCINLNLIKQSDVTILLDMNGNNIFNPGTGDRKLFFPGIAAGPNCLFWDGKDGNGNYLPVASIVSMVVSVESGEVDLPIFDVESHPNGYSMSVIRPAGALFVDSLFYDDVLVGGSTSLSGCAFPCHTWVSNPINTETNSIGNNNTINSWWFARKQSINASLTLPDYLIVNAGINQSLCTTTAAADTIQLSGSIIYSTASYNGSKKWFTSGTGTFFPNDTVYNAKYIPSLADINAGSVSIFLGPQNECTNPTDTMVVLLNKRPIISMNSTNISCFGQSTGNITNSVSGSIAPFTYSWSNGATTQNLSAIASGSYTVTVSSANSCTSTASINITQPVSGLSGTVNSITNIACFGNNSGAINFIASGGTAPFVYSWSNGATTQNLSGISSGNYTVTVTDVNGCTSATASIAVISPVSALAASFSAVSNVSCNNGNNGSVGLSVNGGTAPYSYLWSNGAVSQNVSNLPVGNYSVIVSDNNGCSAVLNTSISQPSAALVASANLSQNVSCFGGNNGSLNLVVSGGTSPYSYSWNTGAVTQNIGNLLSGSYSVTVTDAQGCTSISGVVVIQPAAALSAAIQSSQNISCFSGTNGAININVSGGTAPFTYSWSNGATTQDISNLTSGTYTITVTDANGCDDVQTIALSQPAGALSGTATVSQQVSCFGGNNGGINLAVNGGTVPYNFNWSNGTTSEDISGLGAGSYSVTVTDANGCTLNQSATVIQPAAAVVANASQSQAVLCNSGNDGQISLTVSGGTTPYVYAWSNGATTQSLSNLPAATYTVTVTDVNGCTSVSAANITQPAIVLSGSTSTTSNISCFSGNNGSIDLTVSGGTAPYSYNWSTGAGSQDLSGLSAGLYSVTITDANGCTAETTGSITQPAGQLSTNINISQNIPCFGGGSGSVDLSVSGGTVPYLYSWSNGASSQDISGLSSGVYTVTISDANGCNTTASVSITQPSAPLSASIGVIQSVSCFGGNNGSLQVTASGGTFPYNYVWSNGQNTQQVLNLTSGVYTVTVTDANGCTTLQNGTILQPVAALSSTALITQQVSCFGGSNGSVNVTIAGGTPPYNFNWSNGNTNEDLSGLSAGTYTLNIVDANGCVTDQTIIITQPAAAVNANATSVQQVSCFGGNNGTTTVTVTGGTAPYAYIWSNGALTQNINSLPVGSYTVTVTDVNGCSDNSTALVNQPVASLSATSTVAQQVSCFGGNNGAINITVSGGTTPYIYLWNNGSVLQDLNSLTAATYSVTITDANGCTTTQSRIVGQPAAALAGSAVSSQNVSCFGGSNGAIALSVSGGTTPYVYTWNTGSSSQNINGLFSGNYTVTITDINGCTTSANASITQPAAVLSLNANSISNVSCFGGNNGIINIVVNGGTVPYSYAWSNGSVAQNISGLGSGTYSVTITDANGCTVNQSTGITQPAAALNASISSQQAVSCFGGNNGAINLNVSGGTSPYSYNWNTGASSQNLNGITAGNYTVTVTDANGCAFIKTATITQPVALLNSSLAVSQNVSCYGGNNGSLSLTANGGTLPYTYLWNTGAFTQNLSGLSSGNYSVIITDINGCTSISNATITQPAAVLNTSTSIGQSISCFGGNNGSINMTVNGGTAPYSYSWSNGANTQNLSGLPSGNYNVIVIDANGCISANSALISQPDEALAASISINQNVSCFGGSNGSVNLDVSGGTFPYSYTWNTGATTQNVTGLSNGMYSVTITDANGCTNNQTVTISQPSTALTATAVSAQSVSCVGGNNGAANLSVSGGTAPYFYSWSNGEITQNINNLAAGTYTVTVFDYNSCIAVTNVTITQPGASLASSASATANVSCFGGTNGVVNLTVSGGTASYGYSWSNGATSQNLSGVASGIYTVTVTDANGCTATANATVTQPSAALSSTLAVTQNVSCFGGNNGSLNLTVSNGTAPYTYIWNNGAATQDINSLATGTYTVTITDANGCTNVQSASISQPSATLSASGVSSQNVSCFGGNNGAINLTVNGGTSPYAYLWSNGITTQDMGSLSSGTYTVTVTDANGCIATSSVTVTQPSAALSTTITSSQNVNCFGNATGSVNLTVTSGTAPYTYNWSNGATTQDISGLGSGTYSVTVTDANSCTSTASVTITQPSAALASSATIDQNVSCFGGTNGSVNLTVTGGTTPYTYNWSNGQTTQDMSGLGAGNYTVTVTDVNGCTTTRTITISQPAAALSATASQSQAVSCNAGNDGQMSLAVSGGTTPYTYVWSTGATTQAINGLTAGTYTVTVTDANGCTRVTSATITQPSAALSGSTTTTSNISCFSGNNGSIDLTVVGGTAPYTYMWSNGAVTQDLTLLPAGSYSVTITDANGCVAASSGTITQPAGSLAANLNVSQNVNCFGGGNGSLDLTVSGGTTPYTYTWSTGATTEDISGLAVGFYTVSITDANGCISSATGSITQPAAALSSTISTSQNVSCFGGNNGSLDLTVNGGTAPYAYTWSNGATSQDINNLSTGNYTVTITDANGCITTQSGSVSQPAAALNATASASANVSCYGGGNGSANLTVTGGTAPYTYSWSNGQTTEDISGLSAGTYTVNITDVNGCNTTTSVAVTEPSAAVSIIINSTQAVSCFGGNDGQAAITANGGTAPYTYLWNTGATTAAVNGLATGTYTVTVTDINGCSESTTVTLSQPVAPLSSSINTSQNVNCFGGNNGSINLSVNGGTAPYSYNWSNGATSQNINNLSIGTYTVSITDANGCTANQTGSVSQPAAALTANVSASANVSCYGGGNGSANLTVIGGTAPYTYNWSNGQTTEDISGLSAGTYTVNIADVNGCITSTSVTVTEPSAAVSITVNSTQAVSCYGGNDGQAAIIANGGTAPYTYLWNTGATTAAVNGLATGTYTVTVTDANGCSEATTVILSQPMAPLGASITAGQNVSCFGGNDGTADLTVNGGTLPYTYLWNTGATTQDVTGLSNGTYTVTVTDVNNCITTQTISISQPVAALSGSAVVTGNISCFSGNNGSIDLTVVGGTAPYTFQWSTGAITEDVIGLGAGMYSVTITDINGCTTITNAEITQPAGSLAASLSVNQNVLCFAGNTGSLDLTVSFGTTPYIFLWNTGATSEDIIGLTSGIYTVNITDANGCITSQSAFVGQPSAALNAQAANVQPVLCYLGSNGSLDINVTGGTAPYNYSWSNGATSEDLNNLSAGIYTVNITDVNGCTFTLTETISQPAATLTSVTSVTQNVLCNSGSDGSAVLLATGGTMPYSYSWSNGAITAAISSLSSGWYYVNITDVNGCAASDSVEISQPVASLASSVNASQNVNCFGGNNGSIDLNVNGGTVPYSFIWNTGDTTEDIGNLVAGTYTVGITDANGCTATNSVTISQPAAALSASVNGTINVNCYGGNNGSIDLNVSGGTAPYSYNWSNGDVSEDVSGLSSGTYSVIVTDVNGCTSNVSTTISEPVAALSTAIAGTTNVMCFGGNNGNVDLVVAGGTAPYSFNWSNGEITEDISGLLAGTYAVSVTDVNGCTSNASVTITEPTAALTPVVTVLQNVNCFGDETGIIDLTVTGGTTPYTFLWSNAAITEDLSLLFAGTYTVTVTDANGCTESGQASVSQPAAPLITNISVISNVFCNGGATGSLDLVVNGGTAPYTYLWNNGFTTEDISNLVTGIYSVTITDVNGCTSIATAGIGQPSQQLNAMVTVQNVLCFNGNSGFVNITPSGGTSPYLFVWNTGAITEDIGGLVAGNYTVSISDANGCDTTITATVIQPSAPLIPALTIAQNVSCYGGSDGSISLNVTGGTLPYVYLWNTGATTAGINGLPSGPYTITVTDANGCNAIISDFVSQPAAPLSAPVTIAQNVSCFGGVDGSLTTNATGGTAPYTYLWNTGATTSGLTGLIAGTYTVVVTDINGCTYSASAQVTQPIAPLVLTGTTTIADCLSGIGGSVTITPGGGTVPYSFIWSEGSTTQNLQNVPPGNYTVTITDANGCLISGNFTVGNSSDLVLQSGPTQICVGDYTNLFVDPVPGGIYQWYFAGNVLNGATSNTFTTPAAGFYYVSVTTSCGTFYSDSIEIIVNSVTNASITSNQIICPPESVQLYATGGVTYEWSPSAFITFTNVPDPVVNPINTTTYSVLVTDANGCKTILSTDIAVACDSLFIPNGFSPNDDGTNDGFVIDGIENYPGNKLWVYNRWGNLVFKTKDYDNRWDGVSNVSGIYIGKKVPTGTYYFILDLNDNSKPRAGYLIIRR